MTERDPSQYVFWLASRSAGIVAFTLVAISVVLGLYMAAGLGRRPGYKRILVKVHEQVALAALVAIGAHGAFLLGDKWLSPGVTGIVVPFTMPYRPLSTGLGIIGGYFAAALGLAYYARRHLGPGRWRRAHRLIVVTYVLGAIHALTAGSDGAGIWLQGIVAVTAAPIAGLLVLRYRPRQRPVARPASRVRRPAAHSR